MKTTTKIKTLVNASRIAYILVPGTGLGTTLAFLAGREVYKEATAIAENVVEEMEGIKGNFDGVDY